MPVVLVVDDEPLIRMFLAQILGEAGYRVVESGTAEDAIERLGAAGISAIVTDIRLGAGASGWDLARYARQQDPEMAVAYMTGDSAGDWVSEGVPTSIMLQKPFVAAQIVTTLAELLEAVVPCPLTPSV